MTFSTFGGTVFSHSFMVDNTFKLYNSFQILAIFLEMFIKMTAKFLFSNRMKLMNFSHHSTVLSLQSRSYALKLKGLN